MPNDHTNDKPSINWLLDLPPGIRAALLLPVNKIEVSPDKKDGASKSLKAILDEHKRLWKVHKERCEKGEKKERLHPNFASVLYESNVAEMYLDPYSYTRLRVIYTQLKQYDKAIQVCQAYIDAVDKFRQAGGEQWRFEEHVIEFRQWISKLRAKTY